LKKAQMKKKVVFLLILIAFAFLAIPQQLLGITRGIRIELEQGRSLFLYKDYQAIVIGVSEYSQGWPYLPNAVKDAIEVATKLKKMGFQVKLLKDPTSFQLKYAFGEMAFEMGKVHDRALLLYYAGHGSTENLADGSKIGYLIPKDCPLQKEDPVGFINKAISMKEIEALALRIRSKHVLMLFDSCFSGAIFTLLRAVPDNISEKCNWPVRQFITAGRDDEPVPDKSIFKRCFLIGLEGDADLTNDGYITGSELGMYLFDKVVQYTGRGQHPQYGKINNPNLDRGDFVFVIKDKVKSSSSNSTSSSFDQDNIRLTNIAKVVNTKIMFRSQPSNLSAKDLELILEKYNFFDIYMNSTGDFKNNFHDNRNGTITDWATGLIWQQNGSTKYMTWIDAKSYVDSLNQRKFAGYSNWRLPTIEELASLIETSKLTRKLFINPLFSNVQSYCWSSDTYSSFNAWYVTFYSGGIFWDDVNNKRYVRVVRITK